MNTIDGDGGRSFGPLVNFVLVERSFFNSLNDPPTTVVAHEDGHACGLTHRGSQSNLMFHEDNRGENLDHIQSAILRNSKFVWYL